MKVFATVDSDGDIFAISASPEGGPRLATPLQPGQSEVEITDHDIHDDDPDDQVHRKLNEIRQSKPGRARLS